MENKSIMILLIILISFIIPNSAESLTDSKHVIVAIEEGKFLGWPANNGAWIWDNEILVGFTVGKAMNKKGKPGHKIEKPFLSKFARSKDGGETWTVFDPDNFLGDENQKKKKNKKAINFQSPGFAMRVFGHAYHGARDPGGGFYYSYDKGNTWKGPFFLRNINTLKIFDRKEITPRTDYLVQNNNECLVFISSRKKRKGMTDKSHVIKTRDGGITFEFVSWIVPEDDPYRAVMPQTVQISGNHLVSVLRRRIQGNNSKSCWIDAYSSNDLGKTWSFLSRVGETGIWNGNPPALVKLKDGRLCCVFGNRTKKQIHGVYSKDNGKTWGDLFVIRDNYDSGFEDQDLGYPRLVQRPDGKLIAIYYWSSKENPVKHIAATIWTP